MDVNQVTGEQDPVVKLIEFEVNEESKLVFQKSGVMHNLLNGEVEVPPDDHEVVHAV